MNHSILGLVFFMLLGKGLYFLLCALPCLKYPDEVPNVTTAALAISLIQDVVCGVGRMWKPCCSPPVW